VPALSVATIGIYGFSAESFLDTLRRAGVGRVIDVRQRRGVRGSQYAWANSQRLQAAVGEAGIAYEHRRDLAPTTELRQLQYAEDARQGVGKRSRIVLAGEYRSRYLAEILDHVDLRALAAQLDRERPAALLCVERDPQACHRSLIAARLAQEYGATVIDLVPRPIEPPGLDPVPQTSLIPGG
jgi:uncharacterized protein (DUF488 family)